MALRDYCRICSTNKCEHYIVYKENEKVEIAMKQMSRFFYNVTDNTRGTLAFIARKL